MYLPIKMKFSKESNCLYLKEASVWEDYMRIVYKLGKFIGKGMIKVWTILQSKDVAHPSV